MTDVPVQLVVSAAHAERIELAVEWVIERCAEGPVRVIAASQRAADELARTAAGRARGLLGVQRSTLARTARQRATPGLAVAGRTLLSTLAAEAMAVRATHRVTAEAPLEYFGPVQRFAGFGRAAARTLLELRLAEIQAPQLTDDQRGRDLARLLTAFEDELTRLGLADAAAVFRAALDSLAAADGQTAPLLLLDVIPTSALERRWLHALALASPQTLVVADDSDDAVVGDAPTSLRHLWSSSGGTAVGRDVFVGPGPRTALAAARRRIFRPTAGTATPGDDSLQFFSAPGEAAECVEIARRILAEATTGRRFDRMAVLLPRTSTYHPLLEDALRRADIPMFSTARTRRPAPGGRALLALLACAAENLSAARFAEYLSLGQVPPLTDAGAPPSDPVPWVAPSRDGQLAFATSPDPPDAGRPTETDESPAPAGHLQAPLQWERLLVDAGVRAGAAARWRRRLEGYDAELRLQLRGLADDHGAARARKRADLRTLGHLIRFAIPLVEALERLPEGALWSTWLQALRDLSGRALRAPLPVLAVLADLAPMAEVGPVTLDEVRQVLHARLSFLQEEPRGHRYGKVFVAPVEEAAGRSFEVVFLPGLAEGVFPAPIYEDPLLLDEAREALGPGLAVAPRRRDEERRRLRGALGAAEQRLVASYPRVDILQGRPRVPSFYAFDLLRAAHGTVPSLPRFEQDAAAATGRRWGWPAPVDPRAAIDDGEYDLAVLGPHLFEPTESVLGRGRYLMDDGHGQPRNPYLVRALSAEARRWRPAWTFADGLVDDDPEVSAALAAHRPDARPFSATALQHFTECPYRFVLQAIHRLRPREPVGSIEDLDPLTRGSLFHEVQFRFLQRVAQEGPLTPARLDEARGWLDEAHTRVSEAYRDRLAPPIAAVWNKAMDHMRVDLHGWLGRTIEASGDWQPAHAELAFGLVEDDPDGRDPQSVAAPAILLDRYRLRGAIDLVEVQPSTGELRVTDHKTGRAIDRSLVHIGGGRHLQPALYALAAAHVLERPVSTGRLFFCTRRGGYAVRSVTVDEDTIAAVRQLFSTLDDAFDRGFFPAAPAPYACGRCDYRRVCGPLEERRVKAKRADGLVALENLRGLP